MPACAGIVTARAATAIRQRTLLMDSSRHGQVVSLHGVTGVAKLSRVYRRGIASRAEIVRPLRVRTPGGYGVVATWRLGLFQRGRYRTEPRHVQHGGLRAGGATGGSIDLHGRAGDIDR